MDMPASCSRGSDIDRNAIFRLLYDRWVEAKAGRNGTALGDMLGIRKQIVSGYRTGGDGRIPPWWALVRLMHALNLEARVTSVGVVITGRRGRHAEGPGMRAGDVVIPFALTE